MLIRDDRVLVVDEIAAMIAKMNNNTASTIAIKKGQLQLEATDPAWQEYMPDGVVIDGLYKRGSYGSHPFFDYKTWPENLSDTGFFSEYGVCDTIQQVLDQCPKLQDSKREFIVMFTPVLKANQSDWGGWRWHKWGPYIGTKEPQCEYLYDEPEIDGIFCYHIYETDTVEINISTFEYTIRLYDENGMFLGKEIETITIEETDDREDDRDNASIQAHNLADAYLDEWDADSHEVTLTDAG